MRLTVNPTTIVIASLLSSWLQFSSRTLSKADKVMPFASMKRKRNGRLMLTIFWTKLEPHITRLKRWAKGVNQKLAAELEVIICMSFTATKYLELLFSDTTCRRYILSISQSKNSNPSGSRLAVRLMKFFRNQDTGKHTFATNRVDNFQAPSKRCQRLNVHLLLQKKKWTLRNKKTLL